MRSSDWSSDVCSSDLMLPVERVIAVQGQEDAPILTEAYTGSGHLVNSRFLNGMDVESAKQAVINRAEDEGWGQGTTIWRLRRSEEHTSELQSLMRISYAVFCLKKKK